MSAHMISSQIKANQKRSSTKKWSPSEVEDELSCVDNEGGSIQGFIGIFAGGVAFFPNEVTGESHKDIKYCPSNGKQNSRWS